MVEQNAGLQSVNLTGISSGAANEDQLLVVSARSSNPALIPAPVVSYTSPRPTGSLVFKPVAGRVGAAIITVTVKDGQGQGTTVERYFTVTVGGSVARVSVGSTEFEGGQRNGVALNLEAAVGVTNLDLLVSVPPGTLSDPRLEFLAPEVNASRADLRQLQDGSWSVHLVPVPGQVFLGSQSLAMITFEAVDPAKSAIVPVCITMLHAKQQNGTTLSRRHGQSGRVIVVGETPLLELRKAPQGGNLVLYGKVGSRYAVQATAGLDHVWVPVTEPFTATSMATPIGNPGPDARVVLYRAVKLGSWHGNN
jgi:hypothetical protein